MDLPSYLTQGRHPSASGGVVASTLSLVLHCFFCFQRWCSAWQCLAISSILCYYA